MVDLYIKQGTCLADSVPWCLYIMLVEVCLEKQNKARILEG